MGQVHDAGKEFAFQKATEGTTYVDPTLATNMSGGSAAGMLMGVYHYAQPDTSTNDAVNEANWFLSNASEYVTSGYLHPVLDVEAGGPSLSTAALSQWVNTFATTIRDATGVDPIIYCNTNYATNELDSTVTSHDLWIANWSTSYGDPLTTGSPPAGVWGSGNWDFWQYSSTGSVSGIGGNVDLDVYQGDRLSLEANFLINNSIVVYQSDFESGAGSEWSKTATQITPVGNRRFLGDFGGSGSNPGVKLSLDNLPTNELLTVSFELYVIRSWDGNGDGGSYGPDIWQFGLDGQTPLLSTTFKNSAGNGTQAYPDAYPGGANAKRSGADEINTLGYTAGGTPMDAVYHVNHTFLNLSSSLVLNFTHSGLQSKSDESWGLDNVKISVPAIQSPFTPNAGPGIIEIENFDDGGEGVAYHDTTK